MSRPLVIAFLAMVAGIVAADLLLYDATWMASKPERVFVLWICILSSCALITLLMFFCNRRESHRSIFVRRSWFPLLTVLFFLILGFGRYAHVAEYQHRVWAEEGRPVNYGNPDEFDYVRWRWIQGRTLSLSENIQPIRAKLLQRLERLGLEPQTITIVSAMALGERGGIKRELRQLFADTGSSHLLALSGLHLGIIVGLFLQLMNGPLLLSRWRRLLGIAVLAFIWMYALIAGLPTSLLRASLMTSIFVIACLLNRYGAPLQHLLLTAFTLLLWRPMFLFDVGAQLSFLSVLGILVLYRPLYMFFFSRWRYQIFWMERYHLLWPFTTFAVSLCAQVFTLPLVAYYFHQIPIYGALISIILIPLTTLIIYLALAVLLLTFLWPLLAQWLSIILSWSVSALIGVMMNVSKWPNAVIQDFWSEKAEPQIIIYHNRRCPALHVISSSEHSWLLTPTPDSVATAMYYIRRDFWKRRLTAEPLLIKDKRSIAMEGGFQAVMLCDSIWSKNTAVDSIPSLTSVDILWLTRGFRGSCLRQVAAAYKPGLLVLDASLPRWQRQHLHAEARQYHWRVYDIAKCGALRLKKKDSYQRAE